jgi:hypothetical protein
VITSESDPLQTRYAGPADLAISAKSFSGLARSPRAIKMISSTSTRRSPRSISETKLWVLPNLSAAWICVSFARRRAAAKHAPTIRYCSGSIHNRQVLPAKFRLIGASNRNRHPAQSRWRLAMRFPVLCAMLVVVGSLRQLFSPFAASRQPHSTLCSHAVPIAQHKRQGATASRLVRRFRSVS